MMILKNIKKHMQSYSRGREWDSKVGSREN